MAKVVHLGYSPALELGYTPALELGYIPALELGHSLALELGYSPTLELGYIPALELGSGPALVLGHKRYLECSPAWELGCKRTPPHGKHFNPEAWPKNNKALTKAEDLKGSSDTRRVNSSDSPRRSSRSKMRRFVEPVFKTDDRR